MRDEKNTKCVIVIDESLPVGMQANTAAILGITLGTKAPELVGGDATDASGQTHPGIIKIPVPILKGSGEVLRNLREKLCSGEYDDMVVADFSDVAQSCNIYSDYLKKASNVPEAEHTYYGLAICGGKKAVNRLTGNMPLLR